MNYCKMAIWVLLYIISTYMYLYIIIRKKKKKIVIKNFHLAQNDENLLSENFTSNTIYDEYIYYGSH